MAHLVPAHLILDVQPDHCESEESSQPHQAADGERPLAAAQALASLGQQRPEGGQPQGRKGHLKARKALRPPAGEETGNQRSGRVAGWPLEQGPGRAEGGGDGGTLGLPAGALNPSPALFQRGGLGQALRNSPRPLLPRATGR